MMHPYLQMICTKCGKPIETILEPCPHCGYQHPLTEAGKKLAAEKEVPPRFSEPRKYGTMFVYRHIDVLRVVALAKTVTGDPKVIDVGCGNGDFTERLLEYLPNTIGVDVDPKYAVKPFIKCVDINDVKENFDLAFLGWMELGVDYRRPTAKVASVIVSVWERGGACGIDETEGSASQDFEKFGFSLIAHWRTPCWFDISMRLRTPSLHDNIPITELDVGSIWDVWVRPDLREKVRRALRVHVEKERSIHMEPYDFEKYIDQAGYTIWKKIDLFHSFNLWEVSFHE